MIVLDPSAGTPRSTGRKLTLQFDHWCDLSGIDESVRQVNVLHCYAQRYELLQPYKEQIRHDWLRLRVPYVETDPTAVYMHVRRTDYVPGVDNPNQPERHCLAATLDDYAACLKEFPEARRLIVATDDPRDPFMDRLKTLGLPVDILGGRWDTDFLALASARWLIMPQSTYSWWAGFLGRAERIVCPIREGTHWWYGKDLRGAPAAGQRDYPNLYVYDEPERWTWLNL